jgi:uncharacterized repeat protein (TIGR01451 family)
MRPRITEVTMSGYERVVKISTAASVVFLVFLLLFLPQPEKAGAQPVMEVFKAAVDVNGGEVAPGDVITYYIILSNLGTDPMPDDPSRDEFVDPIPSNTYYIPFSAQASSGSIAYDFAENRIEWNGGVEAGALNAVTLSFSVALSGSLSDGEGASNQGILHWDSDGDGVADSEEPSDDPRTPLAEDDPTVVTVGSSLAGIYAEKTVTDLNGGSLIPGEELQYNVVMTNMGPADLDAGLVDPLPDHTDYVADSARAVDLNGEETGSVIYDPVGNTVTWQGSIASTGAVTLSFRVTVQPGTPAGTVISNQGTFLYDSDGDGDLDSQMPTDDPLTPEENDPTTITVSAQPVQSWYLAEGCTDGGFETWVLVQNPGVDPVHVDLLLQTDEGERVFQDLIYVEIPPGSRRSFNLGRYVQSYDVSTRVNCLDGEVICERAVYWGGREGGHDSIGVTVPASTWYLAEGCTDGGFETWVLVQNPGRQSVHVNISFQTSSGERVPEALQNVEIPAGSRRSFNVGAYVVDYHVSTKVECTDGEVICERAVYWGGREGGHDSIGYAAP